ncbi:hypothetical protein KQX54_002734 [Cotesia glomerata]|uniref:Uncharacterized protein n=1 Tax=Cotesia glomerata TaxID=32391 RepID=A0AAV7HWJ4_COTGL|nr:hypothetical protein KQX54_002734 [Cotesia glomerata]
MESLDADVEEENLVALVCWSRIGKIFEYVRLPTCHLRFNQPGHLNYLSIALVPTNSFSPLFTVPFYSFSPVNFALDVSVVSRDSKSETQSAEFSWDLLCQQQMDPTFSLPTFVSRTS